jgi:signal transduction histidine kinase
MEQRHMSYVPWSPRTWRATANAGLDLVYGVIVGSLLVSFLSLGIGLLVIGIGLFVIAGTLVAARWFGAAFRAKLAGVLLVEIPGRRLRQPEGRGILRAMWSTVTSRAAWKELLHGVLMVVLGPLWVLLVTVSWSLAFALIGFPFYAPRAPDGPALHWHLLGGSYDAREWSGRIVAGLLGVGMLFVASWIAGLTARADVALARGLLGRNEAEELRAQVDTLRTTRAAVVDAADAERRRIERDLHDGVQPQLVSVAMNLGLAQRKLEEDPDAALELMKQAHEESKRAIVELRNVIRGVHPAVLAERGLDPALSALAARSPVPVTVDVGPELGSQRLDPTVEAVAYFVVAEALTNVARHAEAKQADIRVRLNGDRRLVVDVHDDGRGGATPLPGSGLSGLADRVAAVDGTLTVNSPPGGGTVITLEVPCES